MLRIWLLRGDNIKMNLTATSCSCELNLIVPEWHPVFQICDVSEDISVSIIRGKQSQWPGGSKASYKDP